MSVFPIAGPLAPQQPPPPPRWGRTRPHVAARRIADDQPLPQGQLREASNLDTPISDTLKDDSADGVLAQRDVPFLVSNTGRSGEWFAKPFSPLTEPGKVRAVERIVEGSSSGNGPGAPGR